MAINFSKNFPLCLDVLCSVLHAAGDSAKASLDEIGRVCGLNYIKTRGVYGWLNMLGLHNLDTGVTPLGHLLLKKDPFMTRHATRWLLHYKISSNPDAEVWFWMTNYFLQNGLTFTIGEAENALWNGEIGKDSREHLRKALRLYIRGYIDSDALGGLGILHRYDSQTYQVNTPLEIDPLIIGYALYEQRNAGLRTSTATIENLLSTAGSVGKIFLLTRGSLLESLRQLEFRGLITVAQVADLDNVGYTYEGQAFDILKMCYEGER